MSLALLRWIDVTPRHANFHTEMINMLMKLEFYVSPTGDPNLKAESRAIELVESHLRVLEYDATDLELESTAKRLARIRTYLKGIEVGAVTRTEKQLADEARVLREAYTDDLKDRYVFVPEVNKPPNLWWGQDELFGSKVFANFPKARDDIRAAGNCFATDNNTACVMHLMRVAERGMRALARRLKVRFKYPLDYADWGVVIKQMLDKLEAKQKKIQALTRGSRKEAELRFYSGTIHQCDFLNDFWRVEAAHARRQYNSLEALNVLNHVRDFMQILATKLKEKS
jgi:hypothetical protein